MIKKRKAIFLDRDGVINKNRINYVKSVDELEIFPQVSHSIKKFNENNFLVVIVTNQSAINRGLTTYYKVRQIHHVIKRQIKKDGAVINKFYFCPHKPDDNCDCRKPKPGLLLRAIKELKIDPTSSWMIGDSDSDIKAGTSVGCKTIKIEGKTDLAEATKMILDFDSKN